MCAASLLPARPLGKTGRFVPILGYGTGTVGFGFPHAEAVSLIRYGIEQGITYLDTAHHYESEIVTGEALRGYRDRVTVATKVMKRNRAAAAADIKLSLQQLGVEYVDIMFIHCVNTVGDLEAVMSKGGAMEAVLAAQRAGLVGYVGISGHARPNVLARALEMYPFDVVLLACGAMDHLVSDPVRFFLPAARAAQCGVVAMKVLGWGRLAQHPDLALRWSLNQDVSLAILGMKTRAEIDAALATARSPLPLTLAEEDVLMREARLAVSCETDPPFWLSDMQVIAWRAGWSGAQFPAPAGA